MRDRESDFDDGRQGSANYVQALREHWLLIAILVAVSVGSAIVYSLTATERYEAGADILVTPVESSDETFIGIAVLREAGVQARSVLTAARLIQTPQVAASVKERLGSERSPRELLKLIEVTPLEQSSLLTVVGESETAAGAAELANAFAETLVEQRTARFQRDLGSVVARLEAIVAAIPDEQLSSGEAVAIQQRLAELRPLVGAPDPTLEITSAAVPPEKAAWPRPLLSVAVALLAALLLGLGLALALELLNPRVNRENELLLEQRLPILARVPRMPRKVVQGYLTGKEPLPGDVREAYRTLRTSLATAGRAGEFPSTILVTSAIPGEGKTMTSVNLAITLSLADQRVILVDGDLRRPMVATVFGTAGRHQGFASLLSGEARPADVLVAAPGHGETLRLILASPEHAHLIDLLEPRRVEEALEELRLHADVIVIDSPPLTEVADALTLADSVDAVVVAVRLGRTRRDRLNELRRMLARRGVAPVGFVVTTRRRPRRGAYTYGSSGAPQPPPAAASRRAAAAARRTAGDRQPARKPASAPPTREPDEL